MFLEILPVILVIEFANLARVLGEWADKYQDKIDRAIITTKENAFLFLVVTNRRECDEELEDALTELELQVHNDIGFALLHLSVQALPQCDEDDYAAFVNPEICFMFLEDDTGTGTWILRKMAEAKHEIRGIRYGG